MTEIEQLTEEEMRWLESNPDNKWECYRKALRILKSHSSDRTAWLSQMAGLKTTIDALKKLLTRGLSMVGALPREPTVWIRDVRQQLDKLVSVKEEDTSYLAKCAREGVNCDCVDVCKFKKTSNDIPASMLQAHEALNQRDEWKTKCDAQAAVIEQVLAVVNAEPGAGAAINLKQRLARVLAAAPEHMLKSVPMVLHCPACRTRHIDEGEFATKVHHTHSCQGCGLTWRPAVVPTVGVQFLPGFKNAASEHTVPAPPYAVLADGSIEPLQNCHACGEMGKARFAHMHSCRPSDAKLATSNDRIAELKAAVKYWQESSDAAELGRNTANARADRNQDAALELGRRVAELEAQKTDLIHQVAAQRARAEAEAVALRHEHETTRQLYAKLASEAASLRAEVERLTCIPCDADKQRAESEVAALRLQIVELQNQVEGAELSENREKARAEAAEREEKLEYDRAERYKAEAEQWKSAYERALDDVVTLRAEIARLTQRCTELGDIARKWEAIATERVGPSGLVHKSYHQQIVKGLEEQLSDAHSDIRSANDLLLRLGESTWQTSNLSLPKDVKNYFNSRKKSVEMSMTNEQFDKMIDNNIELLKKAAWGCSAEPKENAEHPASIEHCMWMLHRCKEFKATGYWGKANRWLGFVQGVLLVRCNVSLDDLKKANTDIL